MTMELKKCRHGLLVFSLSGGEMSLLRHITDAESLEWLSPGIANMASFNLGRKVVFALTRDAESEAAWIAELEGEREGEHELPAWVRWTHGADTGLSARTMLAVFEPQYKPGPDCGCNVPHDSGDFGRCRRLVDKLGYGDRLGEVADAHEVWRPYIEQWDVMCGLMDREAGFLIHPGCVLDTN